MTDGRYKRKDYIIDGVDYYNIEKTKKEIEEIIDCDGREFLSDKTDAKSIRKWLQKINKRTTGYYPPVSALHFLIVIMNAHKPTSSKLTLWDIQTAKQRESRINRNKKALEILISEVKGETQRKSDTESRGNEFYNSYTSINAYNDAVDIINRDTDKFFSLGEILDEMVEKHEKELLTLLCGLYGVVLKYEKRIKNRRYEGVRDDNQEMQYTADTIYSELNSMFNVVAGVNSVIASCLRLIYPDNAERITYKRVDSWIAGSRARYYEFLKNNRV